MNNIKNRIKGLYSSLQKYPYALIFSTVTTFIIIFLINMENYYGTETIEFLGRLAMTTALGFPLFLIIKSYLKRNNNLKTINKVIIRIFAVFLLISYYFFFLQKINMVTMTRYIAINFSLYLFFLVVTYFDKKEKYELYIVKIFSRLIVTYIYSFILIIGINAIIFTIKELLQVPIAETVYISAGLIIAGIFAPIFLLAKIPSQNERINLDEYPNVLKILLLYILMPLITVYTSILYIYFIKIIMIQQLPEGIVTHLVLWYSSLSILILFFIYPFKIKSKWVKVFRFWLPIGLIPLLSMMFLAIGIRINTYGVTESRYYVVLLGLWIMGITIYCIFKKSRNNMIVPLTLAIIILLSVIGPWSSYSISINSQNNRFENLVKKYQMIENNKIVKSDSVIVEEDREEIRAILKYFSNNHQIKDVEYLPDGFQLNDTEQLFGFPYHKNINPGHSQKFSYNIKGKAIAIKDYDYFFHLTNNDYNIENLEGNLKIERNNLYNISITNNDTIIYQLNMKPIIIEFHQKNIDNSTGNYKQEDFIFTDQTNNLKLKFIINSFKISKQKSDNIYIKNLDFYLLINFKEH